MDHPHLRHRTTSATAAHPPPRGARDQARRSPAPRQHERQPPPWRFLSRPTTHHASAHSSTVGGSPRGEEVGDLLPSGARPDSRSARHQPDGDRLAVAVARVARGGLDRVPDRVAEVEHLAAPAVALVLGDHGQLGAQAAEIRPRRRARRPGAPCPQRAARRSAPSSRPRRSPPRAPPRGSVSSSAGSTSTRAGWW